ncbi:hypothetical protein MAPG_02493 [Magnaporthiopsis poae ATCC 64411]|uniref:Uncharacterized protein n=1 Tax=Magnaporthiopsis poae (strain ATCC 64411 / 73-15) TaxID=644358 RepID=A0A0C4DRI4_MAGP6|nr:hypothetical protein MAPG_02493 [Magnaporthiopsis poae ATCC 64411]
MGGTKPAEGTWDVRCGCCSCPFRYAPRLSRADHAGADGLGWAEQVLCLKAGSGKPRMFSDNCDDDGVWVGVGHLRPREHCAVITSHSEPTPTTPSFANLQVRLSFASSMPSSPLPPPPSVVRAIFLGGCPPTPTLTPTPAFWRPPARRPGVRRVIPGVVRLAEPVLDVQLMRNQTLARRKMVV